MAHLVLVIGSGHSHNELLSWALNQSSFSANNYPERWELYPGEFGTFIRHDDAWNLHFDQCHMRVYEKVRNGDDSIVKKHHIEELYLSLQRSYHPYARVSHYLNCLNIQEAVSYATDMGVLCSIASIDLPNSKHRSHYAQMEFSLGAAQSKDYQSLEYSLLEVCRFLTKKDKTVKNTIEQVKDNFSYICDVNSILSDDDKIFNNEMKNAMIKSGISDEDEWQEYSSNAFKKLQYFKFINQPIHPLMKQINEMSWQEIVDIAQQ